MFLRQPQERLPLAYLLLLSCAACDKPATQSAHPATAPPAASELADSIRVVCWNDYITPKIAAEFERERGVKVSIEFINNNEEVIERLAKGEVWDVWTPSDYAVQVAAERGLLAPLTAANIPNARYLGRRFQNASYDPELKYAIPFKWGTTGLGYDRRAFSSPPTSWSVIFDPAKRKAFKGKISLLDDVRETMGIALIYLGLDPNTTDPAAYAKARDLLIATKADLKELNSETYYQDLAAGSVALAHGWGGDLAQVIAENPHLAFALPKEGYMLFIDNLAIPAASTKRATAEAFINYVLRPEVSARLVEESRFASTLPAATAQISAEIAASPSMMLPEDIPFHVFKYLGAANEALERSWQEVQAAR